MSEINFSTEQKAEIVAKLQRYFDDELEHDLGQFEGEFLLDFIGAEIGNYFYNQGLQDARTVLDEKLEGFADALYEIEKPISFRR